MRTLPLWRGAVAHGALLGLCALYPFAFTTAQTATNGSNGSELHLGAPEFVAPAAPDDGTKPNCKAARKYIDLLATGHAEAIVDLFSEKAVHYGSDGKTRRGKDVINTYYSAMKGRPLRISGSAFYQDGRHCFAFLVNGPDDAHMRLGTVDEFVMDAEGKIERLIGFAAPAAAPAK